MQSTYCMKCANFFFQSIAQGPIILYSGISPVYDMVEALVKEQFNHKIMYINV